MKINKHISNIIIIITFIIISLSYNFFKNKNKFTNINQYPNNSIGISLKDSDGKESNINLKVINNKVIANITIINNTKYDLNFTLVPLINYSQVKFSINDNIRDKFTFDLNKNSEKTFQIKLNISDTNTNHMLNFILYNNSKIKHDHKDDIIFTPLITKHNLIVNKNMPFLKRTLSFNDKTKLHKKVDESNTFSLNIENLHNFKKPDEIHVKKDEMVSIPTNISSFDNSEDYAFWLSLNGDQLLINNNLKYLYFKLPNQYAINKNVTFRAPHNKGTYELIGFLITNPLIKEGNNQKYSDIITSSKIKLIVN
ncbi:hypothetical protein [Clostridium sp. L74]|uniref:hypothetical protein n=1 Tax=Clostridium sp. L74 TaxID=1560217 RepID=UPI0006ABADC6|nr:hypothetical protein [Clostridium sp. L74]KOR25405.1 hypothetical protein ND00_17110 [Clostridium sp. L74]